MNIGAFYPQYRQVFFARAFGARKTNTLWENAPGAFFSVWHALTLNLCTRENVKNINIHMQRKNTTAVKILPSTSMACFFCPHVKKLRVPEGKHVQLLKPSSQLCWAIPISSPVAWCNSTHVILAQTHLQLAKPGEQVRGKCKHVRVAFVYGCTHLKIMSFTLISKSQINEFCDFLTHRSERQLSVTPLP